MSVLDRLFPSRKPRCVVENFNPPPHDGVLTVYRAGMGFHGNHCSECDLTLVNGCRKGHHPDMFDPAKQEEFEVISGSWYERKRRPDGTIVKACLYECPDCESVLVKVRGTYNGSVASEG